MTDAYCYIRFSTPRQDRGTSIERQERATQSLCQRNGWTIRETLCDKGRSAFKGAHTERGALGRFRKRVEAGEIVAGTILVVENIDRLSRENPRVARRWIEDITDYGIIIAVCSPELMLDSEAISGVNIGAFLLHALESKRANVESTRKADMRPEVIERQRKKAKAGVAFSACLPGWLTIDNERVVAREDRAEIVRLIYDWATTEGYESIAKRLNTTYAPWNGVRWNSNYVRDILLSEKVEGEYRPITGESREHTGDVILNYYPRIVDAEAVERARLAIRDRKSTGGAKFHEARNLFSGLLHCAECDARMTRTMNTRSGREYEYLVCRASRVGDCTNTTRFRYDVFEKAALNQIVRLSMDNTTFARADTTGPLRLQIANAKKRLDLALEKQPRVVQALIALPESLALQAELRANEAEIAETRLKLDTAEADLAKATGGASAEVMIDRLRDLQAALSSEEDEERAEARRIIRAGIDSVVSRVIFDRDIAPFRSKIGKRHALLILRGNHLAFRFDLADGTMIERIDYTDWHGSPDEFRADQSRRMIGLSKDPTKAEEALVRIKQRASA